MNAARVKKAYVGACYLDVEAIKPGNVRVHAPAHGMDAADFRTSAEVSAATLVDLNLCLGERIYRAVEHTRNAVGCNTNLGIVLLAAPLMQAALASKGSLRRELRSVLAATDVADAVWVYRAIRLAAPGGLGAAPREDVSSTPSLSLLEAMRLAADRDRIAHQYACAYADVFEYALPRLAEFASRWRDDTWALTALYLGFLCCFPDTHVARKFGLEKARQLGRRMVHLEAQLSAAREPKQLRRQLLTVDNELKQAGINPGTSADLAVISLLAMRLEQSDRVPEDEALYNDRVATPSGTAVKLN